MSASTVSIARKIHGCTLLGLALVLVLGAQGACAEDAYDAAVKHSSRNAKDIERDKLDRPAEVLRLTGIKPGMRVADVLAGGGYYSELVSYIVGPKGRVLLLNNPPFDKWGPDWEQRIAWNRLPNVEHRTVDLNKMGLGSGTLDAVLLIKTYHDLYWVDPKGEWPKVNPGGVLDQIAQALKPGGVVLVVDHSSKPGRGSADASSLHRIDEAFARKDFESRGFEIKGQSEVLRRPDDRRDQLSYDGPALGKTDRFVMVFRKK